MTKIINNIDMDHYAEMCQLASKYLKKILEIDPNYIFAYKNLTTIYLLLAVHNFKKGINPERALYQADIFLKKAEELNPNDYEIFSSRADHFAIKACYESKKINGNPEELFDESIKYAKMAIEVNPNYFYAYISIINSYICLSDYRARHNRSYKQLIKTANNYIEKVKRINPDIQSIEKYLLMPLRKNI